MTVLPEWPLQLPTIYERQRGASDRKAREAREPWTEVDKRRTNIILACHWRNGRVVKGACSKSDNRRFESRWRQSAVTLC